MFKLKIKIFTTQYTQSKIKPFPCQRELNNMVNLRRIFNLKNNLTEHTFLQGQFQLY